MSTILRIMISLRFLSGIISSLMMDFYSSDFFKAMVLRTVALIFFVRNRMVGEGLRRLVASGY